MQGEGTLASVVRGSARGPRPTPWQSLWPALEQTGKENARAIFLAVPSYLLAQFSLT